MTDLYATFVWHSCTRRRPYFIIAWLAASLIGQTSYGQCTSFRVAAPTASTLGTSGTWVAPATGGPYQIRITAKGAKGGSTGNSAGGDGATITGTFSVTAGQVLELIAGAPGTSGGYSGSESGSGGGGGSSVRFQNGALLVVAGGGGGAYGGGFGGASGPTGTSAISTGGAGFGDVSAPGGGGAGAGGAGGYRVYGGGGGGGGGYSGGSGRGGYAASRGGDGGGSFNAGRECSIKCVIFSDCDVASYAILK
jgi:hypothetical protein